LHHTTKDYFEFSLTPILQFPLVIQIIQESSEIHFHRLKIHLDTLLYSLLHVSVHRSLHQLGSSTLLDLRYLDRHLEFRLGGWQCTPLIHTRFLHLSSAAIATVAILIHLLISYGVFP